MKQLTIGVDLDGVCGNYYDALRRYVADKVGVPADQVEDIYPDPKTYSMDEWPDFEHNFVKYHTDAVNDGLFENMEAIEGASESLWKLNEQGHHLRVITSRFVSHGQNAKAISSTAFWLDKHSIPYRDIMFVKNKADVYADVYIDDSPENIHNLKAKHPDSLVIIFDTGYNKDLEGSRATNWSEVVALIEEFAQD